MKLVIDIPKETLDAIKTGRIFLTKALYDAFENGTPLPKGHGRLIDADAFVKENDDYTDIVLECKSQGGYNCYKDTLDSLVFDAPTIIEADREAAEHDEPRNDNRSPE